jgi:hypothetical protein
MCVASYSIARLRVTEFRKAFPDLNFWGTADLIAEGDYKRSPVSNAAVRVLFVIAVRLLGLWGEPLWA